MTATQNRPQASEAPKPPHPKSPEGRELYGRRRAGAVALGGALTVAAVLGIMHERSGESEPVVPVGDAKMIVFGGNDGLGGTIDNGIEGARAFFGEPNADGGYDYPDGVDGRDIQDLGGDIHRALTDGDSDRNIHVGDRVELQPMSDGSIDVHVVADQAD